MLVAPLAAPLNALPPRLAAPQDGCVTAQRKESRPARWHSSSESSNVQLKPRHFQVGITHCMAPPLSPQRAQSGRMSDFRR